MNNLLHMDTWAHAWMVLTIIFGGGLIVGKLSEKPRIPDVAAYLALGIIIGPTVLNWVSEPSQSQVNQFILNMGATLILFNGGRSVEIAILRKVWISVTMLSTVGVIISTLVVGLVIHYFLGFSWVFSLLIGSVIASTDPATLIPVFKRVAVIPKLRQTVETESAFNDATGSVLTFTLFAASISTSQIHFLQSILTFLQSVGIGVIVGFIFGLISTVLVSKNAWGIFHEYGSIVMLVIAIASNEIATLFAGSGFMATFAAGVISGNSRLVGWKFASHTENNIQHFGNSITLIMRMTIFVLLGTQVNFHLISKYLWISVMVVFILMLIARPLTVISSVLIDKRAAWQNREIAFMCWVRETGVIPAALSGMLLVKRFPGAPIISAITFMAILLTILIQASTTDLVAMRLGVTISEPIQEEV